MEGYVPKQNANTGGGNGNGPGNTGGNTSGPNPQAAYPLSVGDVCRFLRQMQIEMKGLNIGAQKSDSEVEKEQRETKIREVFRRLKMSWLRQKSKEQLEAKQQDSEEMLVTVKYHAEVVDMAIMHNVVGQPQPDERITQAEYEKVVKGARLTDPVEEPISRSCYTDINAVSVLENKPVYTNSDDISTLDDNGIEITLVDCNKHLT